MRSATALSLLLAVLLVGCRRTAPGPFDAGKTLVEASDAGPGLQFALEALLADGGVEVRPLRIEEPVEVPPVQTLVVTASRPLHNYRIRILDEADRALGSDDASDETLSGLRYRADLAAPLKAGHHYAVLVDAQTGGTFDDGSGRELPEQRWEFRVAGERARPAPATRAHGKRRH